MTCCITHTHPQFSYAKKLGISYDQMLDQSKPEINFFTWSQEENKALMDTMVEEYYLPNAQKILSETWSDVQIIWVICQNNYFSTDD